jgi:predicted RNA-binding protein YlxR (DUF448 family)
MKNYRRCISCRKLAAKESFWRIVRTYPDRKIKLDRGMGRSAYLCPQEECLKIAQKKNRLEKSLKTTVTKEIYEHLWEMLGLVRGIKWGSKYFLTLTPLMILTHIFL